MSEKEKRIMESLMKAVNILPEDKRGYIIGYAEGVIDVSKRQEEAEKTPA